jgi:hypothetical protein
MGYGTAFNGVWLCHMSLLLMNLPCPLCTQAWLLAWEQKPSRVGPSLMFIAFIDTELDHMFEACAAPSIQHELACVGLTNILVYTWAGFMVVKFSWLHQMT